MAAIVMAAKDGKMSAGQIAIALVIAIAIVFGIVKGMERSAKRRLEAFLKKAKNSPVSLENAKYGTVEMSERCVRVKGKKPGIIEVPWNAILRLVAYKRDLWSVDLICLGIVFDNAGKEMVLEINEEMVGFKCFIDALPERFPLREKDWWSKVASSAFVTNMTPLWERDASASAPIASDETASV